MPEGGSGDPPRQDVQQRPDYPPQPTYTPRSSYVICKICDRGTLVSKTVHRMSAPVVAIGFILLVPSIFGIAVSALMLVGVIAYNGDQSNATTIEPSQQTQSDFDANFRRNCARGVKKKNQEVGYSASPQLIEQYCECALSTFNETGSEATASQTCLQKSRDGTLDAVGKEVNEFYSGELPHEGRESGGVRLVRVIGSVSGAVLGITSFVGGLLGWLLVMKKRVLQCNVCGAVVNAS